VKQSQTAGLGDEREHTSSSPTWTAEHLAALRAIRDEVRIAGIAT
jgi:hypothetical protein